MGLVHARRFALAFIQVSRSSNGSSGPDGHDGQQGRAAGVVSHRVKGESTRMPKTACVCRFISCYSCGVGLRIKSFCMYALVFILLQGFTGECGRRGGYVELIGFDPRVRLEMYKLASISLCANVTGQVSGHEQ